MDEIKIIGLEILAYHGVLPEEKQKGQKFYVDTTLYTDVRAAGMADDLQLTVDYGEVCEAIHAAMTEQKYELIEAAAEKTAERILCLFPGVKKIWMEIRKPEAPIPMKFETVAVAIERAWHTAYVAYGSNMGDKENFIEEAIAKIKENESNRLMKRSDSVRTEPYGDVEQEEFLNGVIELQTLLMPEELLSFLQELEEQAGRMRTVKWGPRTLDLDILLYDDRVIATPDLVVPHPDMHNREFVLVPLVQIAGFVTHPVLGKTITALLDELQNKEEI